MKTALILSSMTRNITPWLRQILFISIFTFEIAMLIFFVYTFGLLIGIGLDMLAYVIIMYITGKVIHKPTYMCHFIQYKPVIQE